MLVYCIRLLCDWSFHLYHHISYICYFVRSYLFLLWYSWLWWHCFVLLLEEIQFLSRFPCLSHIQVFLCEMSLVCHLKCPYSCFSSYFCFWVILVLLILMLSVLFLVAVISLSLWFSMWSLSCIDASMLSSMQVSPLPPSFLDTYTLSTSSLGCKALCNVIRFLVLWFICLCSSLIHFKNRSEYLTRGQPRYLSLL